MTAIPVTVTGAGSLFGQGILKCLRMSDLDLRLAGLDYFDTAIGFRWCEERGVLPDLLDESVSEDAWFEALCGHVRASGSRFLFVGADFELVTMAHRATELFERTGCQAIVSPPALVAACKDKFETARLLQSLGLPAPASFLPEDGLDRIAVALEFPMIVKPRSGARSRGVALVRDRAALEHAVRTTERPVIQQYVGDEEAEFTCGVCFLDGAVDSVAVLRRRLKDGNTVVAVSEDRSELDEFCAQVGALLRPFGPLNIQLRLVGDMPVIFEINPRFSGTTVFRALLGVNEPERILRRLLGLPVSRNPRMRRGRVVRYFEEVVLDVPQARVEMGAKDDRAAIR